MRQAYIAEYPDPDTEIILFRAPYWNEEISAEFDRLANTRPAGAPLIQAWYYDKYQVTLMGAIKS